MSTGLWWIPERRRPLLAAFFVGAASVPCRARGRREGDPLPVVVAPVASGTEAVPAPTPVDLVVDQPTLVFGPVRRPIPRAPRPYQPWTPPVPAPPRPRFATALPLYTQTVRAADATTPCYDATVAHMRERGQS